MGSASEETLADIERRFKEAVARRRSAEKALEQLILQRENLKIQRDMLYNSLMLLGADMDRQAQRIVNKFAKLLEMRNDLKADITTTTLTEVHKNTLLTQIDDYVREISKAFDENEIDKAISHMKGMVALIKTAMS